MAIYLIEGKIGAGKTYWMMHALLQKYFHWDDILYDYLPKVNSAIITNIRGIRLNSIDLKTEIDKHGVNKVFSAEYVDELRKSLGVRYVIYCIDEIQQIFDRKYFNKEVFGFFQTCRHHGIDIFGITQDVESVAKELRILQEYTVKAVSRSSGSGVGFTYQYHQDGEKFKTQMLKREKKIFRMYVSQLQGETEKIKPVYIRYVAIAAVLLLACVFSVVIFFKTLFAPPDAVAGKNKQVQKKEQVQKQKKEVTVYAKGQDTKEAKKMDVPANPVPAAIPCDQSRASCEKECIQLSSAKVSDGSQFLHFEEFQCKEKIVEFREGKVFRVHRSKT